MGVPKQRARSFAKTPARCRGLAGEFLCKVLLVRRTLALGNRFFAPNLGNGRATSRPVREFAQLRLRSITRTTRKGTQERHQRQAELSQVPPALPRRPMLCPETKRPLDRFP